MGSCGVLIGNVACVPKGNLGYILMLHGMLEVNDMWMDAVVKREEEQKAVGKRFIYVGG